jgi:cysteine synthase B
MDIRSTVAVSDLGLLDQVGNTPLLPLRRLVHGQLGRGDVEIAAKAEWHNPSGSVKDRPAANILRGALAAGLLDGDRGLLDSTSGNMGIAYATLAASVGIPIHLTLPANANAARQSILRALGAELTLTDPSEGSDGARVVAAELAAQEPDRHYYADQYANPANWQAHYQTTGPEIMEATGGRVTHFVAGLGTTGTLVGTGRFFKQSHSQVRIIGFQPDGPMHGLEGLKHLASSDVPQIYDPDIADQMLGIKTEDAYAMARRLAREEGLLVGLSSAAAAVAALEVAQDLEAGLIVVIFPDSGFKYLDDPIWSSP